MENNQKYYCSNCNSQVEENDTVCKNCGEDLEEEFVESGWQKYKGKIISFINKFSMRHRISYYLFLGPLLMLITAVFIVILGMVYYKLLRDTVERLRINYIFDYFTYIIAPIPYILPVFVFTYLYLNIQTKLKIIITISVIILLLISDELFIYFGLNTFGVILLSIILLEILFIKYSKKDYSILIIATVIFLGWFQFLSLGDLQASTVRKDYKIVTDSLNVIKTERDFYYWPDDSKKYDEIVSFILFREKDTLQLLLKYVKTWDKSIPSQKWKLENWSIDSVFAQYYYMPKKL